MSVSTEPVKHGLIIQPWFTRKLVSPEGNIDPLDSVEWETRDAVIQGKEGVVFEMKGVEVPKDWSQLATDVIVSKYFRKAGVPETGHETSARQVVHRVAHSIRLAGERQEYFDSPNDAETFESELSYLLITQRAAFNSPVWFNCGLKEAYGITGGAAGNWRWSEEHGNVVLADDSYTHPQVSACFIQFIEDDLMDIAEHVKREMRIFKYGSGAGANFSTLRGKGEPLSNGGTSSGLLSFLDIFDKAAGAIKSGGTTRRAAKMVVIDVDHPDIEEFVEWKVKEEDKARALIAQGYPADFNGEAFKTISGQNANNSVRVTDEFMQAVLDDGGFSTVFRTGGVATKKKARKLLRKIAEATHRCADPGMQYDDNIHKWHPTKSSGRQRATNPCSEFAYLDNTACNLASLNLVKFDDGTFDIQAFSHACKIVFLAQEILVDHASYPAQEIAENSHRHRPLGIGYANLGALLMRRGVPYDSDEGRGIAGAITALMTGVAFETSAGVAALKGPFDAYRDGDNAKHMLAVMEQHRAAVRQIEAIGGRDLDIFKEADQVWDRVLVAGRDYGYRNAQASLLAPTGTISFLMDCDTTGIEPDYALVKHKKLAGGGSFDIINQSVEPALSNLDYGPEQRNKILAYIKEKRTIEGAPGLRDEHLPVFDCATQAPPHGRRAISPLGHVKMMEAVQPFLSGAISKTVNVPQQTTVEEIEHLFIEGWKRGLKAIAIYRDGSKAVQVLTGGTENKQQTGRTKRRRLNSRRLGFTQEARIGGQKVYVRTGEYEDGTLGEIFIDMAKEGATMRSMTNSFAIAISLGLQHGVPLQEYVDAFTFTNFQPSGPVQLHPNIKHASSIIDYVMRMLALEYLGRTDLVHVKPEGPVKAEPAPQVPGLVMADARPCQRCGNLAYRRGGTCYGCDNCGSQTGCA